MKQCKRCDEVKLLVEFPKHRTTIDGHLNVCKSCKKQYMKSWREQNHEHLLKSYKEYREANADKRRAYREANRERRLAYNAAYREANRERRLAYNAAYREVNRERVRLRNRIDRRERYAANPEPYRQKAREWAKNNVEKVRALYHRRRARQKAGGSFTVAEWRALKKQYHYTCLCCHRQEPEIKLAIDHIVPLSRGGKNTIDNLQPLCSSCNSRKYNKTIDYRPK